MRCGVILDGPDICMKLVYLQLGTGQALTNMRQWKGPEMVEIVVLMSCDYVFINWNKTKSAMLSYWPAVLQRQGWLTIRS